MPYPNFPYSISTHCGSSPHCDYFLSRITVSCSTRTSITVIIVVSVAPQLSSTTLTRIPILLIGPAISHHFQCSSFQFPFPSPSLLLFLPLSVPFLASPPPPAAFSFPELCGAELLVQHGPEPLCVWPQIPCAYPFAPLPFLLEALL